MVVPVRFIQLLISQDEATRFVLEGRSVLAALRAPVHAVNPRQQFHEHRVCRNFVREFNIRKKEIGLIRGRNTQGETIGNQRT